MSGDRCKLSTSLCILAVSVLILGCQKVSAAPQPIPPGAMYREDYGAELPSQAFVNRLKQIVERKEHKIEKEIAELTEEQMEIQALVDAQSRHQKEHQILSEDSEDDTEVLPVPAAMYQGKRTSYSMALCHFKICNMGRKRQT